MAYGNLIMLVMMRPLFIGLLLCASVGSAAAQTNIRQVDFKNFSYPWTHSFMCPSKLVWLDMSNEQRVRLVNGRRKRDTGNGMTFTGLTLEQVEFAHMTGDDQTDAIVVLRYVITPTSTHLRLNNRNCWRVFIPVSVTSWFTSKRGSWLSSFLTGEKHWRLLLVRVHSYTIPMA
jgi:hypothetical protein